MSFVRSSKYRHTFGKPNRKEECFDALKVSRSAWDTNLVSANPLFVSVNLEAGGGGAFAVISHDKIGKLDSHPIVNGHAGAVLDTDFNPFNNHIVASASEDCKAMVWQIPEGGLTENLSTPVLTLSGHGRKVGHVLFNPVADNILATTSADFTIKIWDISTGQERVELSGHGEIIQSISWSYQGNLMVTTCKDKKVRVFDVRSNKVVQEALGHVGVKGSRCTTMGDSTYFCTTGFSKTSEREVRVYDLNDLSKPIKEMSIDTSSGMLIPLYDGDTKMLYLAGKGDGNIRYYEWVNEEKDLYYLSEYKSADPLRGICFLPKRACNVSQCEVARAFKVHPTMVEPISFKVPRKSDMFQADLFPDTVGPEPAMSAEEWINGATKGPKLISLENGFVPGLAREFTTTGSAASTLSMKPAGTVRSQSMIGSASSQRSVSDSRPRVGGPNNDSLFASNDIVALERENKELKAELAIRDHKIRQLEAKLAALGGDTTTVP